MSVFERTIDDPNAPPRLRGKVIRATVNRAKMEFECAIPDDATPNEAGYLSWWIGEFVDSLKAELPDLIGDKTETITADRPGA